MPSPFPGMNPYLESRSYFHDFHQAFIPAARAALTPQVVPTYFIQLGEHLYLEEVGGDRELIGAADVDLTPDPRAKGGVPGGRGAVATAVEVTIPRLVTVRNGYLEVYDRNRKKIVTVIEILSPTNKYAGAGRDKFTRKRRRLLRSDVNYVELDLLRGGPRMPFRDLPPCDYYALVSRPAQRPKGDVWPARLRDPLPTVPVPLGPGEPDATLDLQALLHRVYDESGYAYKIYDYPPDPRLSPEDAAWAEALVAAHP